MVTVADYRIVETETGDSYVRLILTGELDMIKSIKTGNFYATTRKCSISSTIDETIAEQMIGRQIPGTIIKQQCEPYQYETDNGETIELSHKWIYTDKSSEEIAIEELVSSVNTNGTTKEEIA